MHIPVRAISRSSPETRCRPSLMTISGLGKKYEKFVVSRKARSVPLRRVVAPDVTRLDELIDLADLFEDVDHELVVLEELELHLVRLRELEEVIVGILTEVQEILIVFLRACVADREVCRVRNRERNAEDGLELHLCATVLGLFLGQPLAIDLFITLGDHGLFRRHPLAIVEHEAERFILCLLLLEQCLERFLRVPLALVLDPTQFAIGAVVLRSNAENALEQLARLLCHPVLATKDPRVRTSRRRPWRPGPRDGLCIPGRGVRLRSMRAMRSRVISSVPKRVFSSMLRLFSEITSPSSFEPSLR